MSCFVTVTVDSSFTTEQAVVGRIDELHILSAARAAHEIHILSAVSDKYDTCPPHRSDKYDTCPPHRSVTPVPCYVRESWTWRCLQILLNIS
jgi:hypothetical protein